MLQHLACPHCGTQNLTTETICFACGEALRPLRPPHDRPPRTPGVMWLGALCLVILLGLGVHFASLWLGRSRLEAGVTDQAMVGTVIALVLAGQVALYLARVDDQRWWELRRAPELPLAQANVGDVVWLRGHLACDTPLDLPYALDMKCCYYRLLRRERVPGKAEWRTVENERNAVDFRVTEGEESVYVPSGGVAFDAPIIVDSFVEGGDSKVQVWALLLEVPISVCGRLDGEGKDRTLGRPSQESPLVATWQTPPGYLTELYRRTQRLLYSGWAALAVAVLVLIATLVRGPAGW